MAVRKRKVKRKPASDLKSQVESIASRKVESPVAISGPDREAGTSALEGQSVAAPGVAPIPDRWRLMTPQQIEIEREVGVPGVLSGETLADAAERRAIERREGIRPSISQELAAQAGVTPESLARPARGIAELPEEKKPLGIRKRKVTAKAGPKRKTGGNIVDEDGVLPTEGKARKRRVVRGP